MKSDRAHRERREVPNPVKGVPGRPTRHRRLLRESVCVQSELEPFRAVRFFSRYNRVDVHCHIHSPPQKKSQLKHSLKVKTQFYWNLHTPPVFVRKKNINIALRIPSAYREGVLWATLTRTFLCLCVC